MRYLLPILLIVGCTPKPAPEDFTPGISVAVAVAEQDRDAPTPAPKPGPKPGECENCGGDGIVGDGTIETPCAECGGDGKIEHVPAERTKPTAGEVAPPKAHREVEQQALIHPELTKPRPIPVPKTTPAQRKAAQRELLAKTFTSYPTYPTRSQSGRTWTGCPDYRHLLTGEHAGMFDANWLRDLQRRSPASIQALHADAHEGRVQWQYVVRGPGRPAQVRAYRPAPVRGGCPNGRCPTPTTRFRLFR